MQPRIQVAKHRSAILRLGGGGSLFSQLREVDHSMSKGEVSVKKRKKKEILLKC